MESGLKFMAFIALFGIAFLCLYAITAINAITKLANDTSRSLDKFITDFNGLQQNVNTTLNNLNTLQKDVSEALNQMGDLKSRVTESLDNYDATSTEIRNLATTADNGVQKVLQVIEPFEELANTVYSKVSIPVNQTLTIVNAVSKAFNAFTSRFGK